MRELKLPEIETVAGATGWLDHRVTDNGRSIDDPFGAPVISMSDSLGNANTGYLGNNNNGAAWSMINSGQMAVGACGPSDFGPCQLPSGNYVIDGTVVGETQGPDGDLIDEIGVACDLAVIIGSSIGPFGYVPAAGGAYCNSVR